MVRQNLRWNKALEDAQRPESKITSENGEESIKEWHGPATFRHYVSQESETNLEAGNPQVQDLRNNIIVWTIIRRLATTAQKTPAGWFGTVLPLQIKSMSALGPVVDNALDVITVQNRTIFRASVCLKRIDSFNVGDHNKDGAREDENQWNQAKSADDIEADEIN